MAKKENNLNQLVESTLLELQKENSPDKLIDLSKLESIDSIDSVINEVEASRDKPHWYTKNDVKSLEKEINDKLTNLKTTGASLTDLKELKSLQNKLNKIKEVYKLQAQKVLRNIITDQIQEYVDGNEYFTEKGKVFVRIGTDVDAKSLYPNLTITHQMDKENQRYSIDNINDNPDPTPVDDSVDIDDESIEALERIIKSIYGDNIKFVIRRCNI